MTFDDKNMIQICSQILEFSDHSNANISAVRLGKFPQSPFSHGPLWRILFLAWARCLVMSGMDLIFTGSMQPRAVEHTQKFCSIQICINFIQTCVFEQKTCGSLGIGGWSLVIAWRLHFPCCFAGDVSIQFADELWPKYHHIQRQKNFHLQFLFLTIYELMIKKPPSWARPTQKVIQLYPNFLLKTSIVSLVEPILVTFRPQKIPVFWRSV